MVAVNTSALAKQLVASLIESDLRADCWKLSSGPAEALNITVLITFPVGDTSTYRSLGVLALCSIDLYPASLDWAFCKADIRFKPGYIRFYHSASPIDLLTSVLWKSHVTRVLLLWLFGRYGAPRQNRMSFPQTPRPVTFPEII